MNRRTLLATASGAFALTLAGCLGGETPADDDTSPDDTPTDDDSDPSGGDTHPRFTETSLIDTGRCDSPGIADVAFDDAGVTVTGCARGRNGCAVPVLGDVSYSVSENTLTVVVASEVERDEDQMCTEALLPLGYEARVVMDGMVPEHVQVIHDDVDGRREVARRSRE